MPLPFNKPLDLKLIALVKANPPLYDSTHEKYMDVDTREVIWHKIGDILAKPAMEFAAIQCQIHFGDYNEEKHKPGLLENLTEYLPENFSSSWGAEKKILKLFPKYQGLSQLEAKHVYTKTARELPTYGVTFFVVKEKQKGKKKMVPRLLGINSESILRLDEETREILQVWPITHVRTYHVGKNDSFTLNFGDYSEKEYSVKTNDAHRIRDILEGYIDIIRKRMCAPGAGRPGDSGAIAQDCVQSSRGNLVSHVAHNPSKIVEQSFIGPSKILPFEQGQNASHGTQVMTVQQIITTNKGSTKQEIMRGEVPMRTDMSMDLVKKLNSMNSNAVKVVTLLGDPNPTNLVQAQKIIAAIKDDFPVVESGVKEAAKKQTTDEDRHKLLAELEELAKLIASLSAVDTQGNDQDYDNVLENAKRIADLTTQIYFSLDPRTKRRSQLVRQSRASFIEDEKTEGALRRASFIAAAAGAANAADTAIDSLRMRYNGPNLNNEEIDRLEASAVDKLGKLNAAVALFLTSHSDSSMIDYAAALNSMNTIKEIVPVLATDAKAISHGRDGEGGQEVMSEVTSLCEAARRACLLAGCEDVSKIRDVANECADSSGKLVYIFGTRNPRVNADKENEIVELSRQVGDRATQLLVRVHELAGTAAAGPAAAVDAAGVAAAEATRDLFVCAQLTAPTIHEAHCQSALSAAAESVSTAAQKLTATWKPLVEGTDMQQAGEDLTLLTMELAKALDALKASYSNLETMEVDGNDEVSPERAQILRFAAGVGAARQTMLDARILLKQPLPHASISDSQTNELHDNIGALMAQANVSVAKLRQATSDVTSPDYTTAETAVATISELAPHLVKDARSIISTYKDERSRQATAADVRAWCDAIRAVCEASAADSKQDLEDTVKSFGQASKKLSFVFSPRARRAREQLLLELFGSAHEKAMQMVGDTNKMAGGVGGANEAKLRDLSIAVEGSARALRDTLEVTAPTLSQARCRSAISEQTEALQEATTRLAEGTDALADDETGCRVLAAHLQELKAGVATQAAELHKALAAARLALQQADVKDPHEGSPSEKIQRLKLVTSASAVQAKVLEIKQILQKPVTLVELSEQEAKDLEVKRARELAAVNAAIALLLHAQSDQENPDYEAAERAMKTVSELMPGIVQDTQALTGGCAEAAARRAPAADMLAWSAAIRAACAAAATDDALALVDSAQQLADTSTKLHFIFNPRRISAKGQQVMHQSQLACENARQISSKATDGADGLPPLPAAALRARATQLAAAARALHAAAQLTAPSIEEPQSKQALLASSAGVGSIARDLVAHTATHAEPSCRDLSKRLATHKEELVKALHSIEESCQVIENSPMMKERRKLQQKLKDSSAAAENKAKEAGHLLDQPMTAVKLEEKDVSSVQENVSTAMARINAAIASVITARSVADPQETDYATAQKSFEAIAELTPQVVYESRKLVAAGKETDQKRSCEEIRDWCKAVQVFCSNAATDENKDLKESALNVNKYAQRLHFVSSPRHSGKIKEIQVVQLSKSAHGTAQRMVSAAGAAPPLRGPATGLARAAHTFLTVVELTAHCLEEAACKANLLSSADNLSAAGSDLVRVASQSEDRAIQSLGEEAGRYQALLDEDLTSLRTTVATEDKRGRQPPKVPQRTTSFKRTDLGGAGRPAAARAAADATRELLDHLRRDATRDLETSTNGPSQEDIAELNKKTEEERLRKDNFNKMVETVDQCVLSAEKALDKMDTSNTNLPLLDVEQVDGIEKQIGQKLALAGAAAAQFVTSNHPDEIDYTIATKSAGTLSELVPDIVKDAALLSNARDEKARRALLEHIRALCAATRRLVGSAKHGDKELYEAAIEFGDRSAILMYAVSAEVDPAQEKGVVERARGIGDRVSRLCSLSAAPPAPARRAAAAAAALAYTAKLVAPSVHHQQCQNSLIAASHELSSRVKELSSSCIPLSSDPPHGEFVSQMSAEATELEKLLVTFIEDLAAGRLVKRREVEKIVIEDTALRSCAALIMTLTQEQAQSSSTPERERRAIGAYARALAAAIRALDIAQARCTRRPHDLGKYRDYETAIQNLQVTLLQSRPALGGGARNNIVDLNDFVKDASNEAEKFLDTVDRMKFTKHQEKVEELKLECKEISKEALKVLNPTEQQDGDENSLDGIAEVNRFAQKCDGRIEKIKSLIQGIQVSDIKHTLHEKSLPLVQSCNFLRFASESALAVGESAALYETLDDLEGLEKRLDKLLQPFDIQHSERVRLLGISSAGPPLSSADTCEGGAHLTLCTNEPGLAASRARLAGAAGGDATRLPAALLAYVTQLRHSYDLADSAQRNRVKQHLSSILRLLKEVVAVRSARAAAWQPAACARRGLLTHALLQELSSLPASNETAGEGSSKDGLDSSCMDALLMPSDLTVDGDAKQLEATLQESAKKLVLLSHSLRDNTDVRTAAPAVVKEALTLAAAAKGLTLQNPVLHKRAEQASQEMCAAAYTALAGAARARDDCDTTRRATHCRALVDAVNQLSRACIRDDLRAACGEAGRVLLPRETSAIEAVSAAPYRHCLLLMNTQGDIIQKLNSNESVSREEFAKSLKYIATAVCNSADYAAQCAYLISISEQHKELAKEGLPDVPRLRKLTSAALDSCYIVMTTSELEMAKEEGKKVVKVSQDVQQAVKEAIGRIEDAGVKKVLTECSFKLGHTAAALGTAINETTPTLDKLTIVAASAADACGAVGAALRSPALRPPPPAAGGRAAADHILADAKELKVKTQELLDQVSADAGGDGGEGGMTWVTYRTARAGVLDAFQRLMHRTRQTGERAGLVEATEVEEEAVPVKSFVQIQETTARKWLQGGGGGGGDVAAAGRGAVEALLEAADQTAEDMKAQDREEMETLIKDAKTLLADCSNKYDNTKAGALLEAVREIRRALEKNAVSRVVEDLLDAEEPLQDLDILLDAEPDASGRALLLERKIAELMSALGRTTRVARLLARAAPPAPRLAPAAQQTELLAPQLAQAARERLAAPGNRAVLERYRSLLAQYSQSLAVVRELCDTSVDPLDFVQTAGETMERMREESGRLNDPALFARTSNALTRLVRRVVCVSMASEVARTDPELRAALAQAAEKLPPSDKAVRASRLPDWKDTAEQILRTTGEVESALGGENIFKKLPEPDQPIYNAALSLHSAVRGWSARDNELVAVAKRMAVLMARLSDQMMEDRKRELIATSKSIVVQSREVAAQARRLAHECPDTRIRTNLLQVCERIPTISGQLKMLTTVKSSALGLQGGEEDREAMNMLVTNAQNLMSSVQEVVKAAASASVKIASQRGLKWVRKNY